jgi:hypothetical protein
MTRKKQVVLEQPTIDQSLIDACEAIIKRARRRETVPPNPHGATLEQLISDCHSQNPEVRSQVELICKALSHRLVYYTLLANSGPKANA